MLSSNHSCTGAKYYFLLYVCSVKFLIFFIVIVLLQVAALASIHHTAKY